MSDSPRLQWSKMSPDRSEQVVVRGDDKEQMEKDIEWAKGILPTVAFPNDVGRPMATPPEQAQEQAPVCPKHNKPMAKGQWGWYCKTKDDTQPKGWCTYRPK